MCHMRGLGKIINEYKTSFIKGVFEMLANYFSLCAYDIAVGTKIIRRINISLDYPYIYR